MIRRLAVVMLALGAAGLIVSPAGAASAASRVNGTFTGTTSYTFTTDGCSFVHQVYGGTLHTRNPLAGTFHLAGCVALTTEFTYTGTFELRAHGGTLTGTVAGSIRAEVLPCSPFHFVLTVTAGSGAFHHTSGTIALRGTWCNRGAIPAVDDPISGDFTSLLTR